MPKKHVMMSVVTSGCMGGWMHSKRYSLKGLVSIASFSEIKHTYNSPARVETVETTKALDLLLLHVCSYLVGIQIPRKVKVVTSTMNRRYPLTSTISSIQLQLLSITPTNKMFIQSGAWTNLVENHVRKISSHQRWAGMGRTSHKTLSKPPTFGP